MRRDNIEALVREYLIASGASKKELLERLLGNEGAEQGMYSLVFGPDQRAALRALADACRKKKSSAAVKPLVMRDADKLMNISDDKARKTAFALIGECAPDECAQKLFKALRAEQTRFVRPSIILALGNSADAAKYLQSYAIEPGEDKHIREEQDALKKALSKGMSAPQPADLKLPDTCALTSINKKALRLELEAANCVYGVNKFIKSALDTAAENIEKLRCYSDALFHIGARGEYRAAAKALDNIVCGGLSYRIEAGYYGAQLRQAVIREVSEGFNKYGYADNPSAYSFEIRVIAGNIYAVFKTEDRFAYRKQSIPASINPVAAASIMRICLPYMKDEACVLDPFCGSGTMLIERGYIKKTGALVGVDISPFAIKAACENRKASGLKIALIKGDILGYGGARYDEIISNMPFGLRVSGHGPNIKLYRAFADKLETLLKEDGVAFLFTQEKKLLRDTVGAKKGFTIIQEENFETGGLCPMLFVIKRGVVK